MIQVHAHRDLVTGRVLSLTAAGHSDDVRVCAAASILSTLMQHVDPRAFVSKEEGVARCSVPPDAASQIRADLLLSAYVDMHAQSMLDLRVTWGIDARAV